MASAAPTVLSVATDSAWVVVLAVSIVTFFAALLMRLLIRRPGGVASGVLAALPLLLPLVAAVAYAHGVLPDVAVLRPVGPALVDEPGGLLNLLKVVDPETGVVIPYTLSGSAGSWLLVVGLAVTSFMLFRRFVGIFLLRGLIARCTPIEKSDRPEVGRLFRSVVARSELRSTPRLLVLPPGVAGAFAVGIRKQRVLLGYELLATLDEQELEAIIAHEVAHLEARDVPLVCAAGLLRDMVAWNPVAHMAWRHLLSDRELEADRRAATLTGDPLAVASGLLKMLEVMKTRRWRRQRLALAFLRPRGHISRRVTNLLAIADGGSAATPGLRVPYVFAAALVAVLGLQAGARLASEAPGALAIVWGGSDSPADEKLWTSRQLEPRAPAPYVQGVQGHAQIPERALVRPLRYPAYANGGAVRRGHFDEWVHAIESWTLRQNVSPITDMWEQRQNWKAVEIFDGPFLVYRMERLAVHD